MLTPLVLLTYPLCSEMVNAAGMWVGTDSVCFRYLEILLNEWLTHKQLNNDDNNYYNN